MVKPVPPTLPNPPLPPNPSKISSVTILIVALVCLLLGGGIVYAWQKYFLITSFPPLPPLPSNPSVSSFPSPSVSPQVPADWLTYTNRKCGYEIKYPPDWRLNPEPENALYGSAVIYPYEIGSGVKTPADWLKLQIGCAARDTNSDPKNIVDQLNQRDSGYGLSKFESQTEINLNGSIAVRQINVPQTGDSILEYYIFPEGNKYYSLGFTPSYTNQTTILDQILSTFKFTDNNCGGCPQYVAPHPDACKNGHLVDSGVTACGCQLPPKCILN